MGPKKCSKPTVKCVWSGTDQTEEETLAWWCGRAPSPSGWPCRQSRCGRASCFKEEAVRQGCQTPTPSFEEKKKPVPTNQILPDGARFFFPFRTLLIYRIAFVFCPEISWTAVWQHWPPTALCTGLTCFPSAARLPPGDCCPAC